MDAAAYRYYGYIVQATDVTTVVARAGTVVGFLLVRMAVCIL